MKRNKGFGYVSPTDGTRIGTFRDHTTRARGPSSENGDFTYTRYTAGGVLPKRQ